MADAGSFRFIQMLLTWIPIRPGHPKSISRSCSPLLVYIYVDTHIGGYTEGKYSKLWALRIYIKSQLSHMDSSTFVIIKGL